MCCTNIYAILLYSDLFANINSFMSVKSKVCVIDSDEEFSTPAFQSRILLVWFTHVCRW